MGKEINFSAISSDQRLSALLEAYQTLDTGETLVIISEDNFFPLIAEFQKQYWCKYTWTPLQVGPPQWKGEITKYEINPLESIARLMSFDHSRCDQLFAEGETALTEELFDTGKELLFSFITCMRRHFVMEEQLLFPVFEEYTGMTEGPTSVMRMEHQQIRNLLDQLAESLNNEDYDRVFAIGETLNILIQQHNLKEENMLYPMCDQQLEESKEDLLKKMQLTEIQKINEA